MGTILSIGFEENNLRADLFRGAQSLREWIGRLHGNIDGAVIFAVASGRRVIEDDRHFRKAVDGAPVRRLQESGKFHCDDLRFFGQQQTPQRRGELHSSRHHREVAYPPAFQAPEFDVSFE
jgi:hypothetical protein